MRTLPKLVAEVRSYYATEPTLLRVALNAVSWVEANLAMDLLTDSIPEKSLVTAANIREAIKDLPRYPLSMAVDLQMLARTWELERDGMGWARAFEDPGGDYALELLGDGNHCYDLVVLTDEGTHMWMPDARDEDLLNPAVVDLVMERQTLLKNVVELVEAMGLPFNPIFYLSLEDWRCEYATAVFDEVTSMFGDPLDRRDPEPEPDGPHGTNIRYRGQSEDEGLTWLM